MFPIMDINNKVIGFGAEVQSKLDKTNDEMLQSLMPQDLLKYGLIPEFIGRLPIKVALNGLRRQDYLRILKEPKNAIVRQYSKLCEMDGCELVFKDSGLEKVVDTAIEKKTGARGLRAVFERILRNDMFALREENRKSIIVDDKYVTAQLAKTDEEFKRELEAAKQK